MFWIHRKTGLIIIVGVFLFFITSCATYYQRTLQFQDYITNAEYEKANEWLVNNRKDSKGKNQLLHYLNRGWVSWILNNYSQSNQYFSQADNIIDSHRNNLGLEALALITNPTVKPYKPEDFEVVMVNYFKALNYLNLNQYDKALVECRKINIKLNQLNDKYKDHKNRYQNDAFAHTIMGLIYDANNDYNNAFIAYRNALEVYENSYTKNFNIEVPEQLKWDIIRTASFVGFYDEVDYYEKKFNLKYQRKKNEGGELIFIWHNGFGPVKSEWSINFTVVKGEVGWISCVNDEYGLSFPLYIGDKPKEEQSAFSKLSILRIAFPKYLERQPLYKKGEIKAGNKTYSLELSQSINAIAFKTLNDRMLREMANSMLRAATKKALEMAANESGKGDLGTAINIINAMTEKTDTRNWQTLPYEIYYTRIPLPEGSNIVELTTYSGSNSSRSNSFTFNLAKGNTAFFTFNSIASLPLQEK